MRSISHENTTRSYRCSIHGRDIGSIPSNMFLLFLALRKTRTRAHTRDWGRRASRIMKRKIKIRATTTTTAQQTTLDAFPLHSYFRTLTNRHAFLSSCHPYRHAAPPLCLATIRHDGRLCGATDDRRPSAAPSCDKNDNNENNDYYYDRHPILVLLHCADAAVQQCRRRRRRREGIIPGTRQMPGLRPLRRQRTHHGRAGRRPPLVAHQGLPALSQFYREWRLLRAQWARPRRNCLWQG